MPSTKIVHNLHSISISHSQCPQSLYLAEHVAGHAAEEPGYGGDGGARSVRQTLHPTRDSVLDHASKHPGISAEY